MGFAEKKPKMNILLTEIPPEGKKEETLATVDITIGSKIFLKIEANTSKMMRN